MWISLKNTNKKMSNKLLKIGELAQIVGVLPSTINFYTNEGLLKEVARSRGGYRLYQGDYAVKRIRSIQKLQQDKRLTISEIKKIVK